MNSTNHCVQMFKFFLNQLQSLSKLKILDLTRIAYENFHYSQEISKEILDSIFQTSADERLPFFYLIDSIIKHSKNYNNYIYYFETHICEIFFNTLSEGTKKMHQPLFFLVEIWNKNQIYSPIILEELNKIIFQFAYSSIVFLSNSKKSNFDLTLCSSSNTNTFPIQTKKRKENKNKICLKNVKKEKKSVLYKNGSSKDLYVVSDPSNLSSSSLSNENFSSCNSVVLSAFQKKITSLTILPHLNGSKHKHINEGESKLEIKNEDSERVATAIKELYSGKQCSTCGFRCTKEKIHGHLDFHFKENEALARRQKKYISSSRDFFLSIDNWISLDIETKPPPPIQNDFNCFSKNNLHSGGNIFQNQFLENKEKIQYHVECGEYESSCSICKENFISFWNDDLEKWMWFETLRIGITRYKLDTNKTVKKEQKLLTDSSYYDKLVHQKCYESLIYKIIPIYPMHISSSSSIPNQHKQSNASVLV